MHAGPSRHPLLTSCDANPKVRVRSCSWIFSSHRVGVYPNVDARGHETTEAIRSMPAHPTNPAFSSTPSSNIAADASAKQFSSRPASCEGVMNGARSVTLNAMLRRR